MTKAEQLKWGGVAAAVVAVILFLLLSQGKSAPTVVIPGGQDPLPDFDWPAIYEPSQFDFGPGSGYTGNSCSCGCDGEDLTFEIDQSMIDELLNGVMQTYTDAATVLKRTLIEQMPEQLLLQMNPLKPAVLDYRGISPAVQYLVDQGHVKEYTGAGLKYQSGYGTPNYGTVPGGVRVPNYTILGGARGNF